MKRSQGVTLVETGVVLLLIGIIVGATLPLLVSAIKQDKMTAARDELAACVNELIGYAVENGKLPETYARTDIWGDALRYAVAKGLTESICDKSGNEPEFTLIRPEQEVEHVAFVLSSDGADRLQSVYYPDSYRVNARSMDDDLLAYVSFFQLYNKVCGPSASSEQNTGSYVSFENNFDGFSSDGVGVGEESTPGHAGFGDYDGDGEAEVLLYDDAAMDGDYQGSVCVWYQGSSADSYCTSDGICPLENGVRIYFRIRTPKYNSASEQLSGLVFALLGADASLYGSTSLADICGGVAQNNGFGGVNRAIGGSSKLMLAPKVGVEIDFVSAWPCSSDDAPCDPDDGANHAAVVYWGTRDSKLTYFNLCGGAYSGYRGLYDDVLHGYGGENNECQPGRDDKLYATFEADRSVNPESESNGFAAVSDSGSPWLQDGQEHAVRIEIAWDENTGEVFTTAWVDCENCADLETAFNGGCTGQCRQVEDSLTLGSDLVPYMNAVRFGWTAGSFYDGEAYIEGFQACFY